MGTHLRELSESFPMNTNMTGFRCFSKNICVIVVWTKEVSALEGLILEIEILVNKEFGNSFLTFFCHNGAKS